MDFLLGPGQYTYTAQALQGSLLGSSVLSSIGPIPYKAAAQLPPSHPMDYGFGHLGHLPDGYRPGHPDPLTNSGPPDGNGTAR